MWENSPTKLAHLSWPAPARLEKMALSHQVSGTWQGSSIGRAAES
jgi:hypothetical protein